MTFLKDTWYVAAWADEVVAGAMLARRILNQGVILFRNPSDQAVALQDRCPHRYAPLHLGKLKDGVVECGYHGLQFDGSGSCVFNPHGEGKIPPNAKVESYPLEERHEALWIWMGDPESADPALIPDFSMVIRDGVTTVRGYLNAPANYELMVDNLLDLGHTAYLHPDTLGSEAIVHSTRRARREGNKVVYELWAPDGAAPPVTQLMMPWFQGKQVDHWLVSTWSAPGVIHQLSGFAPAGTNKDGASLLDGLHWLTPETDSTSHYFQALSRNFRLEDPELDALIQMGVKQAFIGEDFPMVGAIQEEMDAPEFGDMPPVAISIDAGAMMARRILREQLARESKVTPTSQDAQTLVLARD